MIGSISRQPLSGKFVLTITLSALTCTLVQANIPLLHRDWILLLLSSLVLFVYGVRLQNFAGLGYLYFYTFIVLINYILGDHYFSSFSQIVCEITTLFVSIGFFDLVKKCDESTIRLLLLTFIGTLIVTAVGTYTAEQIMPGVLRTVQGEILNGQQSTTLMLFNRMGMTNYAFPHVLPILLPICILCVKDRSLPRLIRFVSLVAFFTSLVIIYYSGATTPLLLAIVAIITSLFAKVGNVKSNIIRMFALLVVALFLFFTKEYIAQFFQYMSDIISLSGGSHASVERLDELRTYLLTGDTGEDLEGRVDHYNSTTSIFSTNIILGVNDDSYGGHAALLDRLAVLGLVGFVPFVIFLGLQVRLFYSSLLSSYRMTYVICIITAILTVTTKNMFSREFCIITLLIVPLCLQYLQGKTNK